MNAQMDWLGESRLHFHHGPIDLIVAATSDEGNEQHRAFAQVSAMFPNVLPELVAELPLLRSPLCHGTAPIAHGPIGRRMIEATWPYRDVYITPMAAVAGAVAEHVLAAMVEVANLRTASVNNGGDIALHLAPGTVMRIGIVGDLAQNLTPAMWLRAGRAGGPSLDATIEISSNDPVRGIATSGWQGRSQSLGIADAVTVLAGSASQADAAATIIANAVDIEDSAIQRLPANQVRDDSDLGDIPVTVAVGVMSADKIAAALENGVRRAAELKQRGLIVAAYLQLQGQMRVVGEMKRIAAGRAA